MTLVMGGCTDGSSHPFGAEGQRGEVVPLPADYYSRASSTADREIDYETLYGPGRSSPPEEATSNQFDGIRNRALDSQTESGTARDSINADQENGHQRLAAVFLTPITGSTPDRNKILTWAMEDVLASAGWPIARRARPDALAVKGSIALQSAGKFQKIRAVWRVSTVDGRSLGTVEQNNTVPSAEITVGWNQTARAIATAAASGIFELVNKFR
jgi:hypothetical protein